MEQQEVERNTNHLEDAVKPAFFQPCHRIPDGHFFFLFCSALQPLICLPDPSHNPWPLPPPFLPRAHLQQGIRASGKNQQSALGVVPLFCKAAQLLTVFFALPCKCAGIKAGVMGRRLCGGLLPKPTVAPYNGQGFPWSSSFFCERRRKIMTDSFFCLLAAPSAPCFSLSLHGDSLLQAVDMSIQSLISLGFLSSTLLVLFNAKPSQSWQWSVYLFTYLSLFSPFYGFAMSWSL